MYCNLVNRILTLEPDACDNSVIEVSLGCIRHVAETLGAVAAASIDVAVPNRAERNAVGWLLAFGAVHLSCAFVSKWRSPSGSWRPCERTGMSDSQMMSDTTSCYATVIFVFFM
jgi:hypothetical protein